MGRGPPSAKPLAERPRGRDEAAVRLVFMGTPAFAVPALDALIAAGHTVAAAYTQPPRRADRGRVTRSAVHARAEALGVPVRTPASLRDPADRAAFANLAADAAVVAAYGLILPRAVLEAPPLGCWNLHASLLPRWRGAAPIQRAILAGDVDTGLTIMRMEAGLDTGPMALAEATPVAAKTAGDLTAELAAIGARLITDALAHLPGLALTPQPDAGVSHAPKVDKAEARLTAYTSALAAERAIRAFNPAPGAFADLAGERVRVLAAALAPADGAPGTLGADLRLNFDDGGLRPLTVQPAGGRAMPAADFARGRDLPPGSRWA